MLQETFIIPNLLNTVTFSEGNSYLRLLDAKAQILLSMRLSVPDGKVFLNDQPEIGVWGQREIFPLPPAGFDDRFTLHFRVEQELVVWNRHTSTTFSRFGLEIAERVRYCILNHVQDSGKTLLSSVPASGEMAAKIITKVMLRRMDQLEAQIATQTNPSGS